MDLSNKQL